MHVTRYTEENKAEWDAFVKESKNGTFLFMRDYMDYHSDRFSDHSLMFYDDKERLVALLPANEAGETYYSHQGLTYGGFILSSKVRTEHVLELFDTTLDYLHNCDIKEWVYKQIPTCYHLCPAQEDEYALWRNGAELKSCLISTTIPLLEQMMRPAVERRRKRGNTNAFAEGYHVVESKDTARFWEIMEANLESRYGVKPVHSEEEMKLLMERFPYNIRLYLVEKDGIAQGGCIVYIANCKCVHIQYGHATPTGKQDGVLDMLYLSLIETFANDGYAYLDFGNSNEQGGAYLNKTLIEQKEGFGGRGITYKIWKLNTK